MRKLLQSSAWKIARVLVLLVGVLGALSWGAASIMNGTSRAWFERDLAMRSELAVSGASESLVSRWAEGDELGTRRALDALTRDDRITVAVACGGGLAADGVLSGGPLPAVATCAAVARRLPALAAPAHWAEGDLFVSAVPVVKDGERLGFVVVVHDLTFAARRAATTTRVSLWSFALLALAASAVTFVAVRWARRGWAIELRGALRGDARQRPEFQPILHDVRELVERLTSEAVAGEGVWNADRLKHVLARHMQGERVVIVANREPYIHEHGADGKTFVLHPASGLVTALEPVMRACSGVWIAHGSGSADKESSDRHGRVMVPPGDEAYTLRRVWLSREEEGGYYYGYANQGLWPLCHIAHTRPIFRGSDFEHYTRVNERFADAVKAESDGDDPIVLVQDYHFALAPGMIREQLPRATVLCFWHIPWPNAERLGTCPQHVELLRGMLGASILGFHTQQHCNNFLDAVDQYLEARIDRERHAVVYRGHTTLVRPYPISIEWPPRWLEHAPSVSECRARIRARLGLSADTLLGVGVDRLDYTKGIEERLLAVERLLENNPRLRRRFVFVQIAAPSRSEIDEYRRVTQAVEKTAARINARFGSGGHSPVILLREHHDPPSVFQFYRAADVCYVSSLHDGMNLVAKEFVAARDDEQGVLVLSRFTGAARELAEALIVNPYDLEEASLAIARALTMSAAEQRERMRAMRSFVAEFNVYRWAGRMLVDAARLRSKDRTTHKLVRSLALEEAS